MKYLVPLYILGGSSTGKKLFKERLLDGQRYYMVTDQADIELFLNPKIVQVDDITQNQEHILFGVVLVYKITDGNSFDYIKQVLGQIKPHFVVVAGTHRDLSAQREVSYEKAIEFKNSINAVWAEYGINDSLNFNQLRAKMSIRAIYQFKELIINAEEEMMKVPSNVINESNFYDSRLGQDYLNKICQVVSPDEFNQAYIKDTSRRTRDSETQKEHDECQEIGTAITQPNDTKVVEAIEGGSKLLENLALSDNALGDHALPASILDEQMSVQHNSLSRKNTISHSASCRTSELLPQDHMTAHPPHTLDRDDGCGTSLDVHRELDSQQSDDQYAAMNENRLQEATDMRGANPVSRYQLRFAPETINKDVKNTISYVSNNLIQKLCHDRLKASRSAIVEARKKQDRHNFVAKQVFKVKINKKPGNTVTGSEISIGVEQCQDNLHPAPRSSIAESEPDATLAQDAQADSIKDQLQLSVNQLESNTLNRKDCDFQMDIQANGQNYVIGVCVTDNAYTLAKEFCTAHGLSQREQNQVSIMILDKIQKYLLQRAKNRTLVQLKNRKGRRLLFKVELEIHGQIYVIPIKEGDTPEGLAERICKTMNLGQREYSGQIQRKIQQTWDMYHRAQAQKEGPTQKVQCVQE